MVMPRAFSSGALSIWSYAMKDARPDWAATLVIAAVSVALPWSTWPIVPTFTWGLLRSNFSLAMCLLLRRYAPGYLVGTAGPLLFVMMVSAMLFGTWA